ncbi:Vacuolar protein-sorting-associated protein 36 [Elsinoe australis]|uniref:Vacuolar protein-sorting-associated protein 36 n=1 Tax=Elsinoe australis TaxID=40998 RepID=A0A2P7YDC2_9PEZI|nr:Vacuolar protein-sorting-associated protein 36 [Elsinoe australis]
MILRQLDLTTALRPSLLPEEVLLFVQDAVGLYRDKYKVEGHQNGHAYLTSHRICYVDNEEPRQRSVAIDLKDVDHPELYAGFLKSSPKITLYPKTPKRQSLAVRTSSAAYSNPAYNSAASSPTRAGFSQSNVSPAPPQTNATWICPICSFSNPVPSNFDPSTANASTPLPPCLACGIKPPLVHVTKAAIAAMSNRPSSTMPDSSPLARTSSTDTPHSPSPRTPLPAPRPRTQSYTECPRCTFRNHPSIHNCEICGAPLPHRPSPLSSTPRSESPAPFAPSTAFTTGDGTGLEIIKLSFRAGGVQTFHDRLKDALIQRKWLLESAPPPPKPLSRNTPSPSPNPYSPAPAPPPPRRIGIAALESRGQELRQTNERVMGSAFEDLEALMTSAKEVIAMADRFASSTSANAGDANSRVLAESASALGLVTKDMLGASAAGSAAEKTYLAQLSRDLAEFLTDDRTGVLRREGGIITLVDLWAVFNRRRNGIELVSPRDFEAAAALWGELKLPIRLRRFRSGVLVVQGTERSDEKTCKSLREWLVQFRAVGPAVWGGGVVGGEGMEGAEEVGYDWRVWGKGVSVKETAERFGWSLGVAGEELEMAEERGVLVREQDARGVRFWENHFEGLVVELPRPGTPDEVRDEREVRKGLEEIGLM